MSSLWVYKNKERIDIIEGIISLQWLEVYTGVGEIQLICEATPKNIELLVEDNILYKTDGNTASIIECVDIDDKSKIATITAKGRLTSILLDNTVVLATEQIRNVEIGMISLATKSKSRGCDINVSQPKGYTDILDTQVTWNSTLDALKKLSETSQIGFKCVFNPINCTNNFEVYKGIDRKFDSNNYVGYFGDDMGNLVGVRINRDKSTYKNIAVVAGRGTGSERKVIFVGFANGEERRELYVDADDIDTTYQVAIETGEVDSSGNPIIRYEQKNYTDEEYNTKLTTRGLEKLSEYQKKDSVSAEVEVLNPMEYRKDFNLGDIIPVKSSKYGLIINARITEIREVYEKAGYKVYATLGEPIIKRS